MLIRAGLLLIDPSRPIFLSRNYRRMYSDYLLYNAEIPDEATFDAWRQVNGIGRRRSCVGVISLLNPGLERCLPYQCLLQLLADTSRCEFALPPQYFLGISSWSRSRVRAIRCNPPVLRLYWSYGGFSGVLCARGHRRIQPEERYYMPRLHQHRLCSRAVTDDDPTSDRGRNS